MSEIKIMLTKLHKDKIKKLIIDNYGIRVKRINQSKFKDDTFFLFFENENPNKYLTLVIQDHQLEDLSKVKKFVLYGSGYTTDFGGVLFSALNKGYYNNIIYLNNILKNNKTTMETRVLNLQIANGFLDNIEDSLNFKISYLLSYKNINTQKLSDEVIFLEETDKECEIRLVNQNTYYLDKEEINEKYDKDNDKDSFLKRIAVAYIDYIHNIDTWKETLPNLTINDFKNMNTLDDVINSYKEERTLLEMIKA